MATDYNLESFTFPSPSFIIFILNVIGIAHAYNGCVNSKPCQMGSAFHMICFLHAKSESSVDICHQIVFMYVNVMNRQNVLNWCHAFSESRTNVHTEQLDHLWSLMLFCKEQKNHFEEIGISKLHNIIPEVSMLTLHELNLKCGFSSRW